MRKSTIIKIIFVSIFLFFIMNTLVTAQIYYDSDENVGIGTTEPRAIFDVWHPGISGTYEAIIGGLSTPGQRATLDVVTSHGTIGFQVWDDNDLVNPLFIVKRDGNVGIGTTNPGAALHVKGSTIKLQENSTNAGANFQFVRSLDGAARDIINTVYSGTSGKFDLVFGTDSSTWRDIYLRTDGVNNGIVLKAISGNVGIGDTGPDARLEIVKPSSGDMLNLSSAAGNDGDIVTVDNNGNVGIGTTDPKTVFVVAGGRALFYRIGNDGACTIGRQGSLSDGDILGSCEFAAVSGSGTPTIYASIEGIAEDVSPLGGAIRFMTKNLGDNWYERMRITKAGNVGIGTPIPDPNAKLDVNGPIYQRGSELHADYVFNPDYKLETITEHAEFMWNHKHLKAIPKAKRDENGCEVVEVGAHRKGIVEELEKAHIYIEQLHKRMEALEEKLAKMEVVSEIDQ